MDSNLRAYCEFPSPDVVVIGCELFSGPSNVLVAVTFEDSKLSEHPVVSVAIVDIKCCDKGVVD